MRRTCGSIVIIRANATLGVLKLQHIAVRHAVIDNPGIFAVVLVHRIPPAFIRGVALEIFLSLRIAINTNFAIFEVDKRDRVGNGLSKSDRSAK